jgi:hypothetical protein
MQTVLEIDIIQRHVAPQDGGNPFVYESRWHTLLSSSFLLFSSLSRPLPFLPQMINPSSIAMKFAILIALIPFTAAVRQIAQFNITDVL